MESISEDEHVEQRTLEGFRTPAPRTEGNRARLATRSNPFPARHDDDDGSVFDDELHAKVCKPTSFLIMRLGQKMFGGLLKMHSTCTRRSYGKMFEGLLKMHFHMLQGFVTLALEANWSTCPFTQTQSFQDISNGNDRSVSVVCLRCAKNEGNCDTIPSIHVSHRQATDEERVLQGHVMLGSPIPELIYPGVFPTGLSPVVPAESKPKQLEEPKLYDEHTLKNEPKRHEKPLPMLAGGIVNTPHRGGLSIYHLFSDGAVSVVRL